MPKKLLDFQPGGGADPLDHLAALADQDRLLGRPVDQDAAGDAEEVPLRLGDLGPPSGGRRAVTTSSNWSIVDRGRERQFVVGGGEDLLAYQLGRNPPFRLVGQVVLGEAPARLRADAGR